MPTLSELRAIVRRDAALNSTDVISNADLNTLLNEGALRLATDGHAFVLSATWSAVASTQRYVLSGATPKVTAFLDLYWPANGLVYQVTSTSTKTAPNDFRVTSEAWLDLNRPGWQDDAVSDTLQHAFLGYDSTGNLCLGVHPASSTTTPTFKLYYLSRGVDMDGDTKYPWVNSTSNLVHTEPYQQAIAYWAMYVLSRDLLRLSEEADKFLKLYTDLATQCRSAQRKLFSAEVRGSRLDAMVTASQTFGSL